MFVERTGARALLSRPVAALSRRYRYMGKTKAAERQFKCCYARFFLRYCYESGRAERKCDCAAFKWFFLDESGKAERKCCFAGFKRFFLDESGKAERKCCFAEFKCDSVAFKPFFFSLFTFHSP